VPACLGAPLKSSLDNELEIIAKRRRLVNENITAALDATVIFDMKVKEVQIQCTRMKTLQNKANLPWIIFHIAFVPNQG